MKLFSILIKFKFFVAKIVGKIPKKLFNRRFIHLEVFSSFISNYMLYNTIRTMNQSTYCIDSKKIGMTKHIVTTEYRYCHPHKMYINGSHTDSIACEVQYKVIKCEVCQYYEI